MSHFAKVENGIVVQVIVAEQEFINTLPEPSKWAQTSYNTRGGKHYDQDGNEDSVTPLRKNYAGIGYTYDSIRNAFYAPQPFPSWLLDDETCQWNAPVPMPDDGKHYDWDESTTNWIEAD